MRREVSLVIGAIFLAYVVVWGGNYLTGIYGPAERPQPASVSQEMRMKGEATSEAAGLPAQILMTAVIFGLAGAAALAVYAQTRKRL